MSLRQPPDSLWESYWSSVYRRVERGAGWILFTVGAIVPASYAIWTVVDEVLHDSTVPGFVKVALVLLLLGLAVLPLSVVRLRRDRLPQRRGGGNVSIPHRRNRVDRHGLRITLVPPAPRGTLPTVVALVIAPLGVAAQDLDGRWSGAITIPAAGVELRFSVAFTASGDSISATIDIPQQGARGLPLQQVSHDAPRVHFELPTGAASAVWDGERNGDRIAGRFTQGPATGTFELIRDGTAPPPRTESEEAPYDRHEVQFASGDVTLAGTLTVPRSPGPHPAVVLLSGSGPQNRDEELFGFKVFGVIADHLTRHGIAVLRYDDRGVGGSSGSVSQATTADFAADALAGIALLQARPDIAGDRIGLLGHSEGGIVAPLAATRGDDVAFVVLLAGTALTGEEILYAQGELIVRASGGDDAAVAAQRDLQRRIFAALRTGDGWDSLREDFRRQIVAQVDALPPEQRSTIPDREAYAQAQLEAQLAAVQTPWFRHFVDYDPKPALRSLRAPLLGLFGELDLQVPAELNRRAMAEALAEGGHPDFTLEVLPRANHLFLEATTGSPAEYATLEKVFVPGFLDRISTWIAERVGADRPPQGG